MQATSMACFVVRLRKLDALVWNLDIFPFVRSRAFVNRKNSDVAARRSRACVRDTVGMRHKSPKPTRSKANQIHRGR